MAGIKGRSGRRSLRDEAKRIAIIDLAWDTVNRHLTDEELPIAQRVRIPIELVKKDVPDKIEHSGEVEFKGLLEECLRRSKNV
jgi:hypothetical protein